jgi:hypothetical protein
MESAVIKTLELLKTQRKGLSKKEANITDSLGLVEAYAAALLLTSLTLESTPDLVILCSFPMSYIFVLDY